MARPVGGGGGRESVGAVGLSLLCPYHSILQFLSLSPIIPPILSYYSTNILLH